MGGHAYLATMSQWEHLGKAIKFFGPDKEKFPELAWVYDEKDNVHAEMKILSQLLEAISAGAINSKSRVYIGISKSCCFHCHHTLESANQVLKENGFEITLAVRDSHDVSFGATKNRPQPKWQFPLIMRKTNLSEYSALIQNISLLIQKRSYQAFQENSSSVDVVMGANDASSSSAGEANDAALHKQYLLAWDQALQKSATIVPENSFEQEKHMVAVGLLLHEQEIFEELFDIDTSLNAEDAKARFDALVGGLEEHAEVYFNFLKDPRFSGAKIANCFAKLNADALKLAPKDAMSQQPNVSTSPPPPRPTSTDPLFTNILVSQSPRRAMLFRGPGVVNSWKLGTGRAGIKKRPRPRSRPRV